MRLLSFGDGLLESLEAKPEWRGPGEGPAHDAAVTSKTRGAQWGAHGDRSAAGFGV